MFLDLFDEFTHLKLQQLIYDKLKFVFIQSSLFFWTAIKVNHGSEAEYVVVLEVVWRKEYFRDVQEAQGRILEQIGEGVTRFEERLHETLNNANNDRQFCFDLNFAHIELAVTIFHIFHAQIVQTYFDSGPVSKSESEICCDIDHQRCRLVESLISLHLIFLAFDVKRKFAVKEPSVVCF